MTIIRAGTLVSLLAICGAAQAGPHSVTYSQVSVAPGTNVTIADQQFVAVQLGIREFTTDKRYAVRFLTPVQPGGFFAASLETQHSTDPLPNPNAMIDGLPARIEITDGRGYSLMSNGPSTSNLLVQGQAFAIVSIKAGDALLLIYAQLTKQDQDTELVTDIHRATSQAAYGRYTDPISLVGPTGLDKWVDYIRVIPLN